jgi:hypothetical protein
VNGQTLTAFLDRANGYPANSQALDLSLNSPTDTARFKVALSGVRNSRKAGQYQIAAAVFAGEGPQAGAYARSRFFTVAPAALSSISLTSGEPRTMTAGEVTSFGAIGSDRFGNVIENPALQWSLEPGAKPIGEFSGNILRATTVGRGRVIAASGLASATSGIITVLPGPLASIVLSISADQVVGHPLVSEARMVLLDSFNNLKTDYDLTAQPIVLVPASGQLIPDTVKEQSLLDSGVVYFLPIGVLYEGASGKVAIYATNGTVQSSSVLVSFSGYDIPGATDSQGGAITSVYSGLSTTARVTAVNGGSLTAISRPLLAVHFASDTLAVDTITFTPTANGVFDTVSISLPTAGLRPGPDTIVFDLTASYMADDSTYGTFSILKIPVTIRAAVTFDVAAGSFKPDSAYTAVDFSVSFNVDVGSFTGPIDSTSIVIQLDTVEGQPPVTTIFRGNAVGGTIQNSQIQYANLASRIDSSAVEVRKWYVVKFDYRLYSAGTVFTLSNTYPDSLYIVSKQKISVVAGSFTPLTVAAGAPVAFDFDISLDGQATLVLKPGSALFTITGSGFSATVNLEFSDTLIFPGANHVRTEEIFVPSSQLGKNLLVSASFSYRRSPTLSYIQFATNFGGQQITVQELPVAQIVSAEAVAPNSPKVNTGQAFQVRCKVANLANSPMGTIQLRLTSDGKSVFTPLLTIPAIAPLDTATLNFDVTASTREDALEVFRVDIVSPEVKQMPPVNNVALITIQTPASLALSFTVFGGSGGYTGVGETFTLTVSLTNFGHADVSKGRFLLSTNGINLGLIDTVGEISVLSPVGFTMLAPDHDTTVTISFYLTGTPVDLNTQLPAEIHDTSFTYILQVVSVQADLLLEPSALTHVPIAIGTTPDLLRLKFTNRGVSAITEVAVDSIFLRFTTSSGKPLQVASVFTARDAAFAEAGIDVSTVAVRDTLLVLRFANFTLLPQQSRTVDFHVPVAEVAPQGFSIKIDTGAVYAGFARGPLTGQHVAVRSVPPGAEYFASGYATTVTDFAQSFMIENNPFSPLRGPARFSYVLTEAGDINFHVYTLAGEEVYERTVPGAAVAGAGQQILEWDGRNSRGETVLNGVYLVTITALKSGANAHLKVAVVK